MDGTNLFLCRTTTTCYIVKRVHSDFSAAQMCGLTLAEREMIPDCRDAGVGLIPWSPIARGALARPFNDRTTVREKSDRMLNAMIRSKETEVDKRVD